MPPGSPLIGCDEVASRLDGGSVVVLDASAALPGEDHDPLAAFREHRLPGARFFDLGLFSDPDSPLPHTIPSAGRFARLAGALGIGDDTAVVVYEGRRLFAAARAWFLFRLFGHDDVRVLDGGLPAWRASGRRTESGDPQPVGASVFTPRYRTRLLAGLGDVLRPDPGRVILDARALGRFEGRVPEPRPGVPSGHVPGSRNLPYGALIADDGRMKSPAHLRSLFAASGVGPSTAVVTSCGTGVTAAVLSLGLLHAGFGEAALYDGSWTEYAASGAARAGAGA